MQTAAESEAIDVEHGIPIDVSFAALRANLAYMPRRGILFYGDNLDILKNRIGTDSVDLVYLDPPFNSNRSYNVLFGNSRETEDAAQIQAFGDTWKWTTPETDRIYAELIDGGVPPS